MTVENLTPHDLIKDCYPIAASCISPLVEIIKTNPNLVQEALELAIMIGINAAMIRIDWDRQKELLDKMPKSPAWGFEK